MYLSDDDYAVLVKARSVLDGASQTLDKAAGPAGLVGLGTTEARNLAARLGRCAEACGQAEHGVFRALNVLSSYLDEPAASQAIREWRP